MTQDIQLISPLEGIKTTGDLMALSYFDSLACLGELSLHCGGIKNTSDLLYMARADGNTSILEIGCGTGASTRAMLRAGFNVVVVEPSQRMVAAMARNCLMNAGKIPEHYNAAAENLSEIASGRFDIVLLECVFGFVGDKDAAVSEMLRVLKPNGIVAVTDFHYTETPPEGLQSQLRDMFGLREIMARSDWESYFDAFGLDAWREVSMGTGGIDAHSIELMLSDAKLLDRFPGGRKAIGEFATRFIEWENIFTANRKYMAGHNALWRKPAIAV